MKFRRIIASLMVAACAISLIAITTGCGAQPSNEYVAADRKTHDILAPTVVAILDGTLPLADISADERQDIKNTLDTWDKRIRGAEGATSTPASTASPPGG